MFHSRREFFVGAAATIGTMPLAMPAMAWGKGGISPQAILEIFESLPGNLAIKIHAPATDGKPEFLVESNSSKMLFVGSAIKTFVLCEALRQADSSDVVNTITTKQLALDASVWNLDSASFNPPNLSGTVSERTALEAMIVHSDNTATDMSLKLAGPNNVRAFIASAGLQSTLIPESTRVFFGYLVGAKDYLTFTWHDVNDSSLMIVNPPLNAVETMASSANDLVSYYSRALQGEFFQHKETLTEFRRILSMCGTIYLVPLPLGVSAYVKGGSIDVPGFHAVCVPGGMFFDDRWVYFCFTINWDAPGEMDASTVSAFVAAINQALTIVKGALSA